MTYRFKENWLWYLLILLLVCGNIYLLIDRFVTHKVQTEALAQERLQGLEKEKAVLREQLEKNLNEDILLYSAMILEDLRDEKWKSIRSQFQRIVTLTSARSVEIIDEAGRVLVANDKNQEGRNKMKEYDSRILSDDLQIQYKHLTAESIATLRMVHDSIFLGYLVLHQSDQTANVPPH